MRRQSANMKLPGVIAVLVVALLAGCIGEDGARDATARRSGDTAAGDSLRAERDSEALQEVSRLRVDFTQGFQELRAGLDASSTLSVITLILLLLVVVGIGLVISVLRSYLKDMNNLIINNLQRNLAQTRSHQPGQRGRDPGPRDKLIQMDPNTPPDNVSDLGDLREQLNRIERQLAGLKVEQAGSSDRDVVQPPQGDIRAMPDRPVDIIERTSPPKDPEEYVREFLQECDSRSMDLQAAETWFRERLPDSKVEEMQSNQLGKWGLLRVSLGNRGWVVPAVRRTMMGCDVGAFYDHPNYSGYDPLKPSQITTPAFQVATRSGEWVTKRRGTIDVSR